MDGKQRDFFWPSYVDLMTALFAITLVLFVLSYVHYRAETKAKDDAIRVKDNAIRIAKHQALLLDKVQANLKLFKSAKGIFKYDQVNNRINLDFDITFRTGFQYYQIRPEDIEGDFPAVRRNLDTLGRRIKGIIDIFKKQKERDKTMKDISYLMVISGTASNLKNATPSADSGRYQNSLLSYNRALFLYKYLKDSLCIDFDSQAYHKIIELQISGMGFGGIGRDPVESKNQRFIISIAPKIGMEK